MLEQRDDPAPCAKRARASAPASTAGLSTARCANWLSARSTSQTSPMPLRPIAHYAPGTACAPSCSMADCGPGAGRSGSRKPSAAGIVSIRRRTAAITPADSACASSQARHWDFGLLPGGIEQRLDPLPRRRCRLAIAIALAVRSARSARS
ncbi:MAG TPA: hypothetical protein VMR06_16435 [Dokdonella sp.]|uniref:hypothetical protein n=1 Tax=Dokdonella sp. TaxID=2291710 RepID=UPI002CD5E415|nr:hypothetical protein [Dokdonella sp.]HUD43578.1 hypothetical protein [Dokdonella sp.]